MAVNSPARSIGMVLTATAPALVTASQTATIAGLLPDRISTRLPGLTPKSSTRAVRQPVGPVGQLLVGSPPSVANQRDVIAEPFLDHAVGQFDGGVQVLRIVKLRAIEQQIGPLIERRQVVARKGIHVSRRTQRRSTSRHVTILYRRSRDQEFRLENTPDLLISFSMKRPRSQPPLAARVRPNRRSCMRARFDILLFVPTRGRVVSPQHAKRGR